MKEEAAGGVVYRHEAGQIEILLIADRFGYWSFPKGKKDHGETDEQTALREIEEETQIQGKIRQNLGMMRYRYVNHGTKETIQKNVTYYLVEACNGKPHPQWEEIHAVEWVPLDEATDRLEQKGYENNRSIFQKAKEYLIASHFSKP